ncbi:hypothetical protein L5515_007589 [Caenorhabditis briggsae]|uniref:Uncharacterized protein n=1 Tax=Caenorhabditis briggsae TaxID=6238 RepID=A0AAE9F4Q1_CAEBR|nr:hypothetical protein L5515_007589 [Caenorhabditis briggsae]
MDDFEYKILCCHVAVDVAILCTLEIIVIVATYLTERYNEPTVLSQHKICTTNGPLVFWIIIHLFTDLMALISIYTKNTKLLLGFLVVTSLDLLVSLAYVVVLLAFIILNEEVDKVMIMFMGGMVLFKIYEILTGRRLYWYLLWIQDNMMAPRSALIKNDDNSVFQF